MRNPCSVQCISRKQFVSFNKNWVKIHDSTVSKFINGKVKEHLQFQYWMKLKYKLYEWIVTVTLAMTEWKCSPSAPYILCYEHEMTHNHTYSWLKAVPSWMRDYEASGHNGVITWKWHITSKQSKNFPAKFEYSGKSGPELSFQYKLFKVFLNVLCKVWVDFDGIKFQRRQTSWQIHAIDNLLWQ